MPRLNSLMKIRNLILNEADSIVLLLIASIFVFSDWMVGLFSLTELLILPTILIVIAMNKTIVRLKNIKWVALPIGLVIFHSFLSYFLRSGFDLKVGSYGVIKLAFYVIVLAVFIQYIKENRLEKEFLLWNNIVAMIIGVIGIYITIAIYSDGLLPYEFFWKFTRYDGYLFSEDTFYVRTLSIFYEPAHMGYYLNTILAINLFNNNKYKIHYLFSSLIILFILTTFSYSAIAVMLVILGIALIKKFDLKKVRWNWKLLIPIIILIAIYFIFQETIHTTIIDRTVLILQGKEPSVNERLMDSWKYVNQESILLGNGIGHTPVVWHNFAYMLSEFGIIGLLLFVVFTLVILYQNFPIGIFFIIMNFSKGGYLSPAFWFLILMIILYVPLVNNRKKSKSDFMQFTSRGV